MLGGEKPAKLAKGITISQPTCRCFHRGDCQVDEVKGKVMAMVPLKSEKKTE